jgi:hypothetical protein
MKFKNVGRVAVLVVASCIADQSLGQSIEVSTDKAQVALNEDILFTIKASAQGKSINAIAVLLDLGAGFEFAGGASPSEGIEFNLDDWDLKLTPRLDSGKLDLAVALKGPSPVCGDNCIIARFEGHYVSEGTKSIKFSALRTVAARRPDFGKVNFEAFGDTEVNVGDVPATLTVLSPNGGRKWLRGTRYKITWSSTGDIGANLQLDLYRNGTKSRTIQSSTANDGIQKWTVPADLETGGGYKVRVSSISNPDISDESDSTFKVRAASKRAVSANDPDRTNVDESEFRDSAADNTGFNVLTDEKIDGLGVLQVTLHPVHARKAGARWRIDGGAWRSGKPSGTNPINVPIGSHYIEFRGVNGWNEPMGRYVDVPDVDGTSLKGKYSPFGDRI